MQRAEGDPRQLGKRKLDERIACEPKPAQGLPEAPEHLSGIALKTWNSWKEDLESMDLDARPDGPMLEGACVAYARAVEADAQVLKDGLFIDFIIFNKKGEEVGSRLGPHPAVSVSHKAWELARKFCSEFGLSPVSRTRLTIEKPDDGKSEMAKILSAPREARAAVN